MKKIVSMLITCVLMLNTSFGYTFTLRNGNYVLTREGIVSGTNINFGYNLFTAINWNIISGGITPTRVDLQSGNFAMPENDVEIEITKKPLAEVVNVGDYVSYTPPNTAVTASGSGISGSPLTVTPSNYKLWRVYSTGTDNRVTLVSTSSIGSLTLAGSSGYSNGRSYMQTLANGFKDNHFVLSAWIPSFSELNNAYSLGVLPNGTFWSSTQNKSSSFRCSSCDLNNSYTYDIKRLSYGSTGSGCLYSECGCYGGQQTASFVVFIRLENFYLEGGEGTQSSPFTF